MKKSTFNIFAGLIGFIILSNIAFGNAPDSKPHPILDRTKRIMGGTLNGKWLNRAEIAKYIQGGEKYRLYSQTKFLGEFGGSKPLEELYLSGDKGYRIEIQEAPTQAVIDSIVGVAGGWNALPRIPKVENRKIIQHDPFLVGLIKQNGIAQTLIHINQRIDIDLENDGIPEKLLVASNITGKILDDVSNGKQVTRANLYSIIVLRKMVNGKAQNTVIAANYKELMLNEIDFIADVDGDGQMEFLINTGNIEACYAEGFSTRCQVLYDIQNHTIKKIFANFANPI